MSLTNLNHFTVLWIAAAATLLFCTRSCATDELLHRSLSGTKNGTISESGSRQGAPLCPNGTAELEKCLSRIEWAASTEFGIPTTVQAVDSVCKDFEKGITCADDWAKLCLSSKKQERARKLVRGPHAYFTFLCKDPKFKKEFLHHASCYKRISRTYDICAQEFINNIGKYDPTTGFNTHCCIRLQFLQCVTEISTIHCKEGTTMLQKIVETLIKDYDRKSRKAQSRDCSGVMFQQQCVTTSTGVPNSWTIPRDHLKKSFVHFILHVAAYLEFIRRAVYFV